MATDEPGSRVDGQSTDGVGETVESSRRAARHGRAPRWTDAHTEAAWFLGECVGAGAVLGMVAAISRPRRQE